MTESKKRIALKPHMKQIREWVDAGKTDDWIADALGTSASSVQSFRSRNDIYRRDRGPREPASVFEGVLDHGERDGWGLWLDPAIADDPIWREYWASVDSVVVKVAEDSIVLEVAGSTSRTEDGNGVSMPAVASLAVQPAVETLVEPAPPVVTEELPAVEPAGAPEPGRERGRVKWFDAEKGYGFLVRPTGEDLFVHHSEVEGDAADLGPGGEVEYVVGRNDRGPNARAVRLLTQ
ncbi:MAG: cold shock domain-containing protein [Actinomycetota bacterium]|nr:cold shock domain-containing protein [Actinomycetota bacterium]